MIKEAPAHIRFRDEAVVAGESVAGAVVVDAPGGITCRGIELEIGWRTSGRGDRDEKIVHSQRLHQGSVPPGGIELPFEAAVPLVPWTYHGQLIKIDWFVRIRIDRALALDPRHESSFVVR